MTSAPPEQKATRQYQMHGDSHRQRLLKERGRPAIDGRTSAGKQARAWSRYALARKGGKACRIDIRVKIGRGEMYLWRGLKLREVIVADARRRGTPINRRSGKLPAAHALHDTAMEQWQRINDELELDKPSLDLAQRLAAQRSAQEEG